MPYNNEYKNINELNIEITNMCNLSCTYCYAETILPNKKLNLFTNELYRQTIDKVLLSSKSEYVDIVFHGGEPLLQLDEALIDAMHDVGFEIAIETNGTIEVPTGVDWICVSPKMGSQLVVRKGDELKVVIPQLGQDLKAYEALDFKHHYLQAMDGPLLQDNLHKAIDYCKANPKWKLSLQTHKLLQIP